ncbi:MAG: serine protease [Pseudomonadota bacterium]
MRSLMLGLGAFFVVCHSNAQSISAGSISDDTLSEVDAAAIFNETSLGQNPSLNLLGGDNLEIRLGSNTEQRRYSEETTLKLLISELQEAADLSNSGNLEFPDGFVSFSENGLSSDKILTISSGIEDLDLEDLVGTGLDRERIGRYLRELINPSPFKTPPGAGPITDPPGDLPKVPLVPDGLRPSVGAGESCNQKILENYYDLGISPNKKLPTQSERLIAFKAFQFNCLPPVPKDDQRLSEEALRKVKAINAIRRRVVILEHSSTGGNDCTGLAIDKDIVLTAAHCFETNRDDPFKLDKDNLSNFVVTALDGKTARVAKLLSTGSEFQETNFDKSIARGRLNEDVALVQLDNSIFSDEFELRAFPAALDPGVPLYIFGRRIHHYSSNPLEKVAVVRGAGCRLHFSPQDQSGRLLYQCMTEAGMSGAPVFGEVGGQLYFVGVHQAGVITAKADGENGESQPYCLLKADWCDDLLKYRYLNAGHTVSIKSAQGESPDV